MGSFYEAVEGNPIIAAVKSMEDVEICCSLEDIRVVFILFGDICSIAKSKTPIIAGGLISDKESVMAALSAGAIAVSSTNHGVWEM